MKPQKMFDVRVRFAPSPTGFLHIGGLHTVLYNFLFARHHGGVFILRIEDTDRTRVVPGGAENILKTLEWAGLKWDEGPYIQSERLEIYRKHAKELVEKGSAYYCFCTPDRLLAMRQEQEARKQPPMYDETCRSISAAEAVSRAGEGTASVIRLKIPEDGETIFTDIVHDEIRFKNQFIDDQILLKSDGYPTYHLANVVDDHLMEITHVIRGDEWLPSTPKHVLLYKAFGWELPQFAHLPLLLNADRSKLSKRTGDVAVEEYAKKGYLPEALVNFVALLSWNPSAEREVYKLDELIKEFDLKRINKTGAVVNFEKLRWLNGEYIRSQNLDELLENVKPYLKEAWVRSSSQEYLKAVLALAKDRLQIFGEINDLVEFFFETPKYEVELLRWKKMTNEMLISNLSLTLKELEAVAHSSWTKEELEHILKAMILREGCQTGEVLWPLRVALTGREASPGPFEVAGVLGKQETMMRIESAIQKARLL